MAGKSTVLRSTAAVALLGIVGLHAPATSAQLPYLDAIMLRTFSSDNPLEGNSSFAVEMLEMKCALPHSLFSLTATMTTESGASAVRSS